LDCRRGQFPEPEAVKYMNEPGPFALNFAVMYEMQAQFALDAQEIVDRLYRELDELRAVRLQGRLRRELAARIFRHVHTLKGSAGSFGLRSITDVAHEFEGVLDGVRLGRVQIDDRLLDLFEDAVDAIAQTLSDSSRMSEGSIATLIGRLHSIAEASARQGAIAGSLRSALPEDISRSLSEYDLQHTREAVREGARLFIVDAAFGIEVFDHNFRELNRLFGKSGEIIATIPGQPATPEEITFRLVYAAALLADDLKRKATALGATAFTEIRIDVGDDASKDSDNKSPSATIPTAGFTSVRVGLAQLDDLTGSVTDLLRDTTNAISLLRTAANDLQLDSANANLRRRFVQLEEQLIKLRLVPLSDLLHGAAARAGRVAARQLGKEIEFEIAGGHVGIDKSLAEVVAEPLIHLVRNAVTHGIEDPHDRLAAGKSAQGHVTLRGFSEGSRIFITVSDDGRGIDVGRVAESATREGIVNRPEELTPDQCLRLIFRPGFSTSPEASNLSGRGIGLEVVDRAMEQAGGEVRLATDSGNGTTFTLMIPATLALVQCVIVRSGGQFYCIDSSLVNDRISLQDIILPANGDQSIKWEGENLRFIKLCQLLAQPEVNGSSSARAMLVCNTSEHRDTVPGHQNRIAIAVDAIAGQQETLVRSLGPHSTRWHGISGAAELLDGSVALMIDLARLIEANDE
jgi:two-component system chemotaxis sensor kinase CheA